MPGLGGCVCVPCVKLGKGQLVAKCVCVPWVRLLGWVCMRWVKRGSA